MCVFMSVYLYVCLSQRHNTIAQSVCLCVLVAHNCSWTKCVYVVWWNTIAIAQCRPVCLLASPRLQGPLMSRRRASLFPFFPLFLFPFFPFSLFFPFLLILSFILHSSNSAFFTHFYLFFSYLLFLIASFYPLSAMISSPEFAFTVPNNEAWPGSMQVYL